jgi:hypothetical protein
MDANNWQDEIYRTAIGTDHNIVLRWDNVVYRVVVHTNLNGILKGITWKDRPWSWCYRKFLRQTFKD